MGAGPPTELVWSLGYPAFVGAKSVNRLVAAVAAVATAATAVAVGPGFAAAQVVGFDDVTDGVYYAAPVAALAERGVFAGTECAAGFCPSEPIDRKTMAVWTVRVLDGADPAAASESRFDDVDAASFYAPFIERMAELGVTTGCGDGTGFCPDRNVTRAQMAVFLSRAYELPDGPDPGFSDVASDAWYATDVARLAASKITTGCGDGTGFCPGRDTTRGQMATFLHRAESRRAEAAACDRLRHTSAAPERVEVTAVTVAFDDLPAPGDRYITELGADPQPGFIGLLLAVLEPKLEALSHGRTDWVFHRGGEVRLAGSAHTRARPASLGRQTLSGAASELGDLYPDTILLAFTTATREFPYTSFNAGLVSVAAVEAEDDPEPTARLDQRDLDAYQWSYSRFGQALSAAAHELLHTFGVRDTYGVVRYDGRGPFDTDSGQDSIMGLSSYGWGQGVGIIGGELLQYARPLASVAPGQSIAGGYGLSGPSVQYPHGPLTGWNKWLLGWLDGPETVCVPPGETSTVVVRPHQQTTLNPGRWEPDGDCWTTSGPGDDWAQNIYNKPAGDREVRRKPPVGWWGPAAPNPAIAIIPISATTAVVIEADPWAASAPPGLPQCPIPDSPSNRSTRPVGDLIVYDVDLTATYRPLLLVDPIVAVVSPAYLQAEADLYAEYNLFVGSYFATEVTVHGHRITVVQRSGDDVTVAIEPVES